jgi:hypothetical protein
MRYYHEAWKRRSSKNRVILWWPVQDFKFKLFSYVILSCTEDDVQLDSAQGNVGASRDDYSMEGEIRRFEKLEWDLHCSQGSRIDHVDAAACVHEDSAHIVTRNLSLMEPFTIEFFLMYNMGFNVLEITS